MASKSKVIKNIVKTAATYPPVGAYSQAVLADKTLYVSGVLGMDAQARLVPGGVEAETRLALDNLKKILEAGGASLESVVKTTLLLTNLNDMPVVNQIYGEYFTKNYPARAAYQVARLPRDAAIEIEAIALSGDLLVTDTPVHFSY